MNGRNIIIWFWECVKIVLTLNEDELYSKITLSITDHTFCCFAMSFRRLQLESSFRSIILSECHSCDYLLLTSQLSHITDYCTFIIWDWNTVHIGVIFDWVSAVRVYCQKMGCFILMILLLMNHVLMRFVCIYWIRIFVHIWRMVIVRRLTQHVL